MTSVTFDLEGEILLRLKSWHLHLSPREIKLAYEIKQTSEVPAPVGSPSCFLSGRVQIWAPAGAGFMDIVGFTQVLHDSVAS